VNCREWELKALNVVCILYSNKYLNVPKMWGGGNFMYDVQKSDSFHAIKIFAAEFIAWLVIIVDLKL
jgi:hypothetical protein